jgi:hypothetical protein
MRYVSLVLVLGFVLAAPAQAQSPVPRKYCYYCSTYDVVPSGQPKPECLRTPGAFGRTLCNVTQYYKADGSSFWQCNLTGVSCVQMHYAGDVDGCTDDGAGGVPLPTSIPGEYEVTGNGEPAGADS